MFETKIERLAEPGQSIWLDNISRSSIESGKLKEMIGAGLKSMISGPTIFDKAISSSSDYDRKILKITNEGRSIVSTI
jgi:hypothetical protein